MKVVLKPPRIRGARDAVLKDARDVHLALASALKKLEQEAFWVLLMNIRNVCFHLEQVALGSVASVEVHPRDVFRAAIRCNAAGVVVAHNHPSGDPVPSHEDLALTRRLAVCGELVNVPLVDHVVVTTKGGFTSIRRDHPQLWNKYDFAFGGDE